MEELKKFTKEELKYLSQVYNNPSDNEFLLFHMAKLTEEVGELSEAVLLYIGRGQRKEKLKKFKKENLGDEIADVIIVALQIASTAGIDIQQVLKRKMKKVADRRGSHI